MTYVLATSAATPDAEFPSLRLLARHILAERDRAGGAGQDIRLVEATVGRDALPNGVSIAVRRVDGSARGALIGYAFLPQEGSSRFSRTGGFAPMSERLMAALLEASASAGAQTRAA
jgi:hypothetical protein